MSKYWSDFVHQLVPYVPGEQPKIDNLVKLNTNENPYAPSPKVLEALRAEANEALRRYPDPTSSRVAEAAARWAGVEREQVFVGNGSDEVLAHAFHGLLKHDKPVLFPDISYSFYPVYAGLYQLAFQAVPVNARLEIQIDDYARDNGGIVLANPNAPTGIALSRAEIERLLQRNPDSVVLIDEAYVDFGAESVVGLVARYPQLLVVQTLSKARSLAGLRVGFAFGQRPLIEALTRVKDSFNSYPLDRLASAGAVAALEDVPYFEDTRARVIASREALRGQLTQLGFSVLPSQANFLFARHPSFGGAALAQALRERAVLVRHFRAPRIDEYLRITVGLPEENAALVKALGEILGAR
ncbi:MAG TPA: histidinol-phosphate transaminase [Polyangiales bacterium]